MSGGPIFNQTLVSNREFLERISKEEIERARRFIRQSDRDRYIFSHGLLRSLLGAYVDCAPQQFVFETKQYHKPFLVSPDGSNDIRFNLSHSEDMVLIAVTRGAEVGLMLNTYEGFQTHFKLLTAPSLSMNASFSTPFLQKISKKVFLLTGLQRKLFSKVLERGCRIR